MEEPPTFWGEVDLLKNGDPWETKIYGAFTNHEETFAISIQTFNSGGFLSENLSIHTIPLETGVFKIMKSDFNNQLLGSRYSTYWQDGDVLAGLWNVSEQDSTSYIEITSLDLVTGEVRGNFQVTHIISPASKEKFDALQYPYLDTIWITDAAFHTRIQ